MATIDMSPAFGTAYATRMVGYPTGIIGTTPATRPLFNGYTGDNFAPNTGGIKIMKGIVPTDFSTLLLSTTRASDVLVNFLTGFYDASIPGIRDNLTPSSTASNPIIISTNYISATSSGLGTWFWVQQFDSTNLLQQIIGTVGTVGSGADLEIPDTNIVSGNAYRILNLRLQFPTTWTFA